MRRFLLLTIITAGALCLSPTIPSANACPMCKVANDAEDRRPQAYMYSILFMLGMPATLLTGFGVSFYRLARREAEAELADEVSETPAED